MAKDLRKSTVRPGRSVRDIVVSGPTESRAKIGELIARLDEPVARNTK